jgi:hypothetical protein
MPSNRFLATFQAAARRPPRRSPMGDIPLKKSLQAIEVVNDLFLTSCDDPLPRDCAVVALAGVDPNDYSSWNFTMPGEKSMQRCAVPHGVVPTCAAAPPAADARPCRRKRLRYLGPCYVEPRSVP